MQSCSRSCISYSIAEEVYYMCEEDIPPDLKLITPCYTNNNNNTQLSVKAKANIEKYRKIANKVHIYKVLESPVKKHILN